MMEEVIALLRDILYELKDINDKIDSIRGLGINSIDDVCDKIDDAASTIESAIVLK